MARRRPAEPAQEPAPDAAAARQPDKFLLYAARLAPAHPARPAPARFSRSSSWRTIVRRRLQRAMKPQGSDESKIQPLRHKDLRRDLLNMG